jgi:hypothetical protein
MSGRSKAGFTPGSLFSTTIVQQKCPIAGVVSFVRCMERRAWQYY